MIEKIHNRRISIIMLYVFALLILNADFVYGQCQIMNEDWIIDIMRQQGSHLPKYQGSFSSRSECEQALDRATTQSGNPYYRRHSSCVCNETSKSGRSSTDRSGHTGEQVTPAIEDDKQRAEQERAERERTEAFEREKEKLLRSFKGGTSTGITGLETGTAGLPLKGSGSSQTAGLPLKGSGSSQTTGLKPYDPAIKERTVKSIKQLNCSAYWALNAAGAALEGDYETARHYGEFSAQAKGGGTASGCPQIKVYVPDVPPPVEMNPQTKLYNHIIQQTEILVPGIIETQRKIKDTKNRIEKTEKDIVVKQDRIKWLDKYIDRDRPGRLRNPRVQKEKAEKELDELEKQALELQKVADQLNKTAVEQRGKLVDLQKMYQSVTEDPQRAEELAKKVR